MLYTTVNDFNFNHDVAVFLTKNASEDAIKKTKRIPNQLKPERTALHIFCISIDTLAAHRILDRFLLLK